MVLMSLLKQFNVCDSFKEDGIVCRIFAPRKRPFSIKYPVVFGFVPKYLYHFEGCMEYLPSLTVGYSRGWGFRTPTLQKDGPGDSSKHNKIGGGGGQADLSRSCLCDS